MVGLSGMPQITEKFGRKPQMWHSRAVLNQEGKRDKINKKGMKEAVKEVDRESRQEIRRQKRTRGKIIIWRGSGN